MEWESDAKVADRLHQRGYRLTRPRRAVLAAMRESERALTPAEIHELSSKHFYRLGLVTVYRTLSLFNRLSLVRQVHLPNGEHAYMLARPGHYHALICRVCGRTVEVAGLENLPQLIKEVEERTGFKVEDHRMEFFGVCPDCLQAVAQEGNEATS